MVFDKIKKSLFGSEDGPEYIEIDLGKEVKKSKVLVRSFILKSFEDINPILSSLREGYTIAVIDFKPLKTRDVIELKRAISKIKKTVDALEGSISGFGESIVIATPGFADIYRPPRNPNSADRIVRE